MNKKERQIFQSGFAAGFDRARLNKYADLYGRIKDLKDRAKEHRDYIADLYRRGNQDAECILALQERVRILEAQDE